MQHRLVAVAVVGFWAVMMGTLVRRWLLEVTPALVPGTYRSVLTQERRDYRSRMGIYMRDRSSESGLRRVGTTETVFYYSADRKYRITNVTEVAMPVKGLLQQLSTFTLDTSVVVGKDHRLERFLVFLRSGLGHTECRGQVDGNELVLRTTILGEERVDRLPLPPGGMVASGLSPLVALPPLREGMKWSVTVVDPLSFKPSEIELEVVRRETLHWEGRDVETHVLKVGPDYLKAQAWVSPEGDVLKETLFGLTFIKERPPSEADSKAGQGAVNGSPEPTGSEATGSSGRGSRR